MEEIEDQTRKPRNGRKTEEQDNLSQNSIEDERKSESDGESQKRGSFGGLQNPNHENRFSDSFSPATQIDPLQDMRNSKAVDPFTDKNSVSVHMEELDPD